MLVCGGKVADKLLALQVVAAALKAPFYTTVIGQNRVEIKSNHFKVTFSKPMKEIGRDDWFPKGLEEDEESLCCTVDRHRRRLLHVQCL